MNSSVWLVTSGCYSDYSVVAAFSTEAKAKQALADGLGDNIDTCELDPAMWRAPEGMSLWTIEMDRDGTTTYLQPKPYPYESQKLTMARCDFYSGRDVYHIDCWARDEHHAVKIANEQRVMAIAQ